MFERYAHVFFLSFVKPFLIHVGSTDGHVTTDMIPV